MLRYAEDDVAALDIMNAMEAVGVTVIGVTNAGTATYTGALLPHQRFIVWGKVTHDDQCDQVDAALEKAEERRG